MGESSPGGPACAACGQFSVGQNIGGIYVPIYKSNFEKLCQNKLFSKMNGLNARVDLNN